MKLEQVPSNPRRDPNQDLSARSLIAIFGTLTVVASAVILACQPKPDPQQSEKCDNCPSDMYNFNCELDITESVGTNVYRVVCADSFEDARDVECIDYCANMYTVEGIQCYDVVGDPQSLICLDTDPSTEGDSPPWSPGDFITLSGGTYYIDGAFAEMVKADASLIANDAAWLKYTSTYWQFQDVYSGSLAYELGFRTNDYLKTVNGRNIRNNLQNALDAINDLHEDTTFTVVVARGSSDVTLYYSIDYQ